MSDYKISLGVILEPNDLQQIKGQINKIEADPITIQLDTSKVQSQIDNIKIQLQNLSNIKINLTGAGFKTNGSSSVKNIAKDANWAYQQMLDIQRKANSLSIKIKGLDTSKNVAELKVLSSQLAMLKSDYETLKSTFGSQLSPIQFGNLQAEIDETNAKLSAMDAKIADTKAKLATGIKLNFDNYDAQVASLEAKFGQLSNRSVELRTGIDAVKQALATLKAADGTDAIIAANESYKAVLKQVEAQLRLNTSLEQQSNNANALIQAKQNLALRMSGWLQDNSAAAKKFGAQIQNLQVQLRKCNSEADVRSISKAFTGITQQAKNAGVATKTFGHQLKEQFSKYTSYFSVATLFMYAIQGMRDMFNQVKAIDTAMTELKKVTDETEASYNQFLNNAASRAKEIGTTIDGLVSSTADFARLGYDFADAQGLAEVANIYAVVGDEIDGVEQATESLISTMAAFKDEASEMSNTDFAMSIVDKFNEIGNNFAISSGGIGEALERSASSLDAANNTLDESIALITAANTVVQDPDAVGRLMPTLKMAISVKSQRWLRPRKDFISIF